MELLSKLVLGFHVALAWPNFWAAIAGGLLGTLVGLLPRLSLISAVALLLPVVQAMDTTPALVLLAAVCHGARYGETAAALGGQRAPATRGLAVVSTFFAGCVGILVIALLALPLEALTFEFGAAENFSLLVLGLVGSIVLASGSLIKALAMGVLGLLLAQLGHDASSGTPRFLLDIPQLNGGVNFVALAIGLFGCGELIAGLGRLPAEGGGPIAVEAPDGARPSRQDLRNAWPAVLRGTALGVVLGLLPGRGDLLASFAADAVEKDAARDADGGVADGRGIHRLAARESARSAATRTGFIPALSLGLPPNALMALIVGAMAIKGVQAGPLLMTGKPELFWGLIASMWIGNLALLLSTLSWIGIGRLRWVIPFGLLCPLLLLASCFGVYIAGASDFNVWLMAFVASMAFVFHKLDCETAPLLLGFVLGPMMEQSLRHALKLSDGAWSPFVNRPLSAGLLAVSLLLIAGVLLPKLRRVRAKAFIRQD